MCSSTKVGTKQNGTLYRNNVDVPYINLFMTFLDFHVLDLSSHWPLYNGFSLVTPFRFNNSDREGLLSFTDNLSLWNRGH